MNEAPGDRRALIEGIPLLMQQIVEADSRRPRSQPWLSLDLTMTQLKVLFALRSGPLRPSAIAASIGVSATSATGILDRLADQGYIERRADATDRRAQLIQLTPAATRLVTELHAAEELRFQEVLGGLADDDLGALYRGLNAFANVVRQLDRVAAPE